jgi:hypothetical protein
VPNRVLRDYTDSLRFDGITAEAERLFIRLLTKADDYGRFHADSRLVCAACFPLERKITPEQVGKWMKELVTRNLVLHYESGGKRYLSVINYGQRLRNSRVKFPSPDGKDSHWLPVDSNSPQLAASSGDFPLESESESETESETKTLGASPAAVTAASSKRPELSDDEYLDQLAKTEAYRHLDVRVEYSKMQAWCAANGKQPSRRRYINWLNRAERPMVATGAPATALTKPKGVWDAKQGIDALKAKLERMKGDSRLRQHKAEMPWETEWKPEAKAEVARIRQRIAELEGVVAA